MSGSARPIVQPALVAGSDRHANASETMRLFDHYISPIQNIPESKRILTRSLQLGNVMSIFPPKRPGVTSRHRLRGYDYASPGIYFLTTCINDRLHRLGTVKDHVFNANDAGLMVENLWLTMPDRFSSVHLDEYCIMPNHFHGIVRLGVDESSLSLPSIVSIMDWFKSETTVHYIRGVIHHGWPRYHKRLWLDGYHDHIIRDERDLERIRSYILNNPANWQKDDFYLP